MPQKIFTGTDVLIAVDAASKRLESISITVNAEKFTVDSIDGLVIERGSAKLDCAISIVGEDSEDTDAMTAAEAMALVLSQDAPTALSWTDRAATPVTKLPSNFFTLFPLAGWRADRVVTGSGSATTVGKWTLEMTPNNIH